jgi:hypothetical protein
MRQIACRIRVPAGERKDRYRPSPNCPQSDRHHAGDQQHLDRLRERRHRRFLCRPGLSTAVGGSFGAEDSGNFEPRVAHFNASINGKPPQP